MVLEDVSDRPGFLIEAAPAFDADVLSYGELHLFHHVTVPDSLDKGVPKAKNQEILNRLLAQVMVNPEDAILGDGLAQSHVEFDRRLQVVPERLLDNHRGAPGQTCLLQLLEDGDEGGGRDGQVDESAWLPQGLGQLPAGADLVVGGGDVPEPLGERGEPSPLEPSSGELLDRFFGNLPESVITKLFCRGAHYVALAWQ